MNCLDFNGSFLSWVTHNGSVGRFSLESKCVVMDSASKCIEEYYLASGIMAGNVYASNDLPKNPAYLFQIAVTDRKYTVFRDYEVSGEYDDTIDTILRGFKSLDVTTKEVQGFTLSKAEDISHVVNENMCLIAEASMELNGHQITLCFPIKHINVSMADDNFQIETGPIALPLPSILIDSCDGLDTDCIARAYIFFNTFHHADFLFQVPVEVGNQRSRRYTKSFSSSLSTKLVAIGSNEY